MAIKPLNVAALKRLAKRHASQNGTQLATELDCLAVKEGYQNWSVLADNQKRLAQRATADRPLVDVYLQFGPVDPLLPRGSIQLVVGSEVPQLHFPWKAWFIYIGDDGKPTIYTQGWVDFHRKSGHLSAEIETALQEASQGKKSIRVPDHWPMYTSFNNDNDYAQLSGHGCWKLERHLRSTTDLTYARATGYKPAWYDPQEHDELFADPSEDGVLDDLLDYVYSMFKSAGFRRLSDAERLVMRLAYIQTGKHHATAFQQWLAEALPVLFSNGIARVRTNPNGQKSARRDIVATNTGGSRFFARLMDDHRVRMVIFEAKNYPEPKAADFRQVGAYLNAPHYGSVGFLVTHAPTTQVDEASWEQVREVYKEEGKRKIVIILPSAFLVEQLNDLRFGRMNDIDLAMELWFEDILLKHL
jgi:hypothetical protein